MLAVISRRVGFKKLGLHNSRYNYITYSILTFTVCAAQACLSVPNVKWNSNVHCYAHNSLGAHMYVTNSSVFHITSCIKFGCHENLLSLQEFSFRKGINYYKDR